MDKGEGKGVGGKMLKKAKEEEEAAMAHSNFTMPFTFLRENGTWATVPLIPPMT